MNWVKTRPNLKIGMFHKLVWWYPTFIKPWTTRIKGRSLIVNWKGGKASMLSCVSGHLNIPTFSMSSPSYLEDSKASLGYLYCGNSHNLYTEVSSLCSDASRWCFHICLHNLVRHRELSVPMSTSSLRSLRLHILLSIWPQQLPSWKQSAFKRAPLGIYRKWHTPLQTEVLTW